jgi:hypothetical protein
LCYDFGHGADLRQRPAAEAGFSFPGRAVFGPGFSEPIDWTVTGLEPVTIA